MSLVVKTGFKVKMGEIDMNTKEGRISDEREILRRMVQIFNFIMSRWDDVKNLGGGRLQGNNGARLIEMAPVHQGRYRYRVDEDIERSLPNIWEAIPDDVDVGAVWHIVWYPDDPYFVFVNPQPNGEGTKILLNTPHLQELLKDMEIYFGNVYEQLIALDEQREMQRRIDAKLDDIYRNGANVYLPPSKWGR